MARNLLRSLRQISLLNPPWASLRSMQVKPISGLNVFSSPSDIKGDEGTAHTRRPQKSNTPGSKAGYAGSADVSDYEITLKSIHDPGSALDPAARSKKKRTQVIKFT